MELNREAMEARLDALCAHLQELMEGQKDFEEKNAKFQKAQIAKKLKKLQKDFEDVKKQYLQMQDMWNSPSLLSIAAQGLRNIS